MSERPDVISEEDLAVISQAKERALRAAQAAETVVAQAKVAELEHRTIVQHMFLKYSIPINGRVDEKNGQISWPELDEVTSGDDPGETPEETDEAK
jgi:hypothetical protein